MELVGQADGLYCPQCFVTEQETGPGKSAMSSSRNWAFAEVSAESHAAAHLLSCREKSLIAAAAAYVLSEHWREMLEVVYDFAMRQQRQQMRDQR